MPKYVVLKNSKEEKVVPVSNIEAVQGLQSELDKTIKTTAQELSEEEKIQARQNIGAGTSSFSGSYNELSDKPDLSVYAVSSDVNALLAEKQNVIDSEHKLDFENIDNVPEFITNAVDDLANYYLKSETYTKEEVIVKIGEISRFHYEIHSSLNEITNPSNMVLYLVGPINDGLSDKYEEYVYNNGFIKIGDTSIDLSDYVTRSEFNEALDDKQNIIDQYHKLDYNLVWNTPTIPSIEGLASEEWVENKGYLTAQSLNDYTKTAELTELLANKQDVISDLDVIRTGSENSVKFTEQNLTEEQKAQVRANIGAGESGFSGSYNDLTDKPTLFSGDYNDLTNKPELFSGSYNSLTDKPTLFSGSYTDLTDKPNIPSIEGLESESNKVTSISSESTDVQYVSAKCVYNNINPKVVNEQPVDGMLPNVPYDLGTITADTTFVLAEPVDNSILNHYYWIFRTSSEAPQFVWPDSITEWLGNCVNNGPVISANKCYEVSVLNGRAFIAEV